MFQRSLCVRSATEWSAAANPVEARIQWHKIENDGNCRLGQDARGCLVEIEYRPGRGAICGRLSRQTDRTAVRENRHVSTCPATIVHFTLRKKQFYADIRP